MENTPTSVVCFTNGFSFVTTQVKLPVGEDKDLVHEYQVGPLPDFAVHGTVRLKPEAPTSPLKIFSLARSSNKDGTTGLEMPPGPDYSYTAFMRANINTRVAITLKEGNGSGGPFNQSNHLEGIIKWVQPDGQAGMAVIKTGEREEDKSDKLINCSNIVRLERIPGTLENVSLLVRYSQGGTCTLSYLTRGLTWAPTYTILLNRDTKKLTLEGQACLLCDLSAFTGDPVKSVSLVAGQPRMQFQHICDPLVSGASAEEFVMDLGLGDGGFPPAPPRMAGFGMQAPAAGGPVLFGQTAFSSNGPPAPRRMLSGASAGQMEDAEHVDDAEGLQEGGAVQDFFLYNLKNVPLCKGQPLSMPFVAECGEVGYEDIYCLDLAKQPQGDMMSAEDKNSLVEVQHSIRFTNPCSDQPLTTGPISVLARHDVGEGGHKFLVQGLLKFTGPGKKVTVDITKSMDVQAQFFVETGKERKTELITEGAKQNEFDTGNRYAEVLEQKAKLLVKNGKEEEIKCKVEYQLFGNLAESNPLPIEQTEIGRGNLFSQSLNPTTRLVWELMVPGKGQSELTFNFAVKEWMREFPNQITSNKNGGSSLFGQQ